jgi:hypothetical protein
MASNDEPLKNEVKQHKSCPVGMKQ